MHALLLVSRSLHSEWGRVYVSAQDSPEVMRNMVMSDRSNTPKNSGRASLKKVTPMIASAPRPRTSPAPRTPPAPRPPPPAPRRRRVSYIYIYR